MSQTVGDYLLERLREWGVPQVFAYPGDGAMQMNGLAELIMIGHYWQRWDDPRCVICVLHNNDLSQVTWELRAMGGAPKFEESQVLPDISYAAFARGLGFEGIAWDVVSKGFRTKMAEFFHVRHKD